MSSFDVWYQDLLCLDLMYDIFICLLYISLITWVTGFSPSLFSDRSKLVARKDFLQKPKVRKMWNMKKAQLLYPSCKNYSYFSYFCKGQINTYNFIIHGYLPHHIWCSSMRIMTQMSRTHHHRQHDISCLIWKVLRRSSETCMLEKGAEVVWKLGQLV